MFVASLGHGNVGTRTCKQDNLIIFWKSQRKSYTANVIKKKINKIEQEPRLIKSVRLTNSEYIYMSKRDAVITPQKAWRKDMG